MWWIVGIVYLLIGCVFVTVGIFQYGRDKPMNKSSLAASFILQFLWPVAVWLALLNFWRERRDVG